MLDSVSAALIFLEECPQNLFTVRQVRTRPLLGLASTNANRHRHKDHQKKTDVTETYHATKSFRNRPVGTDGPIIPRLLCLKNALTAEVESVGTVQVGL